MPTREEINISLKRNLRPGKEYDKLIPSATCESTQLGKGDTFFTVEQIKQWITKYSWQVAKLAPALVGRTLQETVNKIYNFERNHIQYELGGATQYIHSPACTWASRKRGVDCKSFSVLSSAILTQLGIKHYIRQIKQPDFNPEFFTHVYVVVPIDQSITKYDKNAATLVLDGSKLENIESIKTTFEDIPMMLNHVGLNSDASVSDERVTRIIENFEMFCEILYNNGVSVSMIQDIRDEVNSYTSQGQKLPTITLSKTGIDVQGRKFPFVTYGLNSDSASTSDGVDQIVNDAIENVDWEGILGDIAGFFDNIFTDVKCFISNSSNNPSKSRKQVKQDAQFLFNYSDLASATSSFRINKFVQAMETYIANRNAGANNSKFDSCTREGNKIARDLMKAFYDKVMAEVRKSVEQQGYKLLKSTTATWKIPYYVPSDYKPFITGHQYLSTVPFYEIATVAGEPEDITLPSSGANGSLPKSPIKDETVQLELGNTGGVKDPIVKKESKTSTLKTVATGAGVAGFMIMAFRKMKTPANTPTTPKNSKKNEK